MVNKSGNKQCPICRVFRSTSTKTLCHACVISYDRGIAKDDGTLWAALNWAADRAIRFERARHKKIDAPDDDFY